MGTPRSSPAIAVSFLVASGQRANRLPPAAMSEPLCLDNGPIAEEVDRHQSSDILDSNPQK
jgi:hypothetical protein